MNSKWSAKQTPKLIWPVLFKRFIDDGFGITKGNREDVIYWIEKYNELRKTVQIDKYNWGNALDYMDLFIYKGDAFYTDGKLFVSIHQKETFKFMYLIALFIKDTLSRTMFGASWNIMCITTRKRKISKNSKRDFSCDFAILVFWNTYWPSFSETSHTHKGINFSK